MNILLLSLVIIEFIIDIIWTRKYYSLKQEFEEVKKNDRYYL